MSRALLCATASCALALLGGVSASAQPRVVAYVLSNPISVIDIATNTVTNPIPAFSENMRGIAIAPNGSRAYVVNYAGTVSVMDTGTNTITATIPIVGSGIGAALTPNGSTLFAANFVTPGRISVIDTATNTVSTTIPVVAGPYGVAITPDGTRAYVTQQVYHPGVVTVIDTATNAIVTTISVGNSPEGAAASPDGKHVYVTNNNSNSVSVIDTTTNTVTTTIPVGSGPNEGIAFTPDGSRVYVTNGDANSTPVGISSISVINTAANTVIATIPDSSEPRGVGITPDGGFAFVTHAGSPTVLVIDTATNTVANSLAVASASVGSPGLAIACIANCNVPTPSPSPVQTPTPTAPLSGAIRYYSSAVPVGGASVQLQIGATTSVQSDGNGQYAFFGIPTGYYQVQPSKQGDQGNGITVLDAVFVLQALAGLRILTPAQLLAADVTGNGTISVLDAVRILQLKAGLITRFEVAQACGSDWTFIPVPAPTPNQALTTPQMRTGVCQAGSIAFEPLGDTATNQDFSAVLFGDVTGNWQPTTPTPTPTP